MTEGLDFDDITAAAKRLDGVAHRTPVITSHTIDDIVGARVFNKAENLQRMGAFKFRGAYNRIAQLSADERERGVCAWSSGNHAQAVALAARVDRHHRRHPDARGRTGQQARGDRGLRRERAHL